MAEPDNRLAPETRLDEYIIRRPLGGGGFGIVYLAEDLRNTGPVVIKEYLPGKLAKRNPDQSISPRSAETERGFYSGRTRFFQEASILATLKHPNIVNVLNFFCANETVYMVMEYEEGANMQHYITKRRGKMSERFLLTVFPALLGALRVIHNEGYLHLDIKPGNIHVCNGGKPLLLDFGAVHRRVESRQRQPGQVTTPGFSPVEQYDPAGYVGPWTDLYALGATIRACIEGRPPPDARERELRDELRPAVSAFRRRYSTQLLEALDWAMEVDPVLRPQTADDLLQALPALGRGGSSGTRGLLPRLSGMARDR